MKKIIIYQFIVLFLTACVGEDFVEREQLFPERLSIITENNSTVDTLLVGDTLQLSAKFINSEGKEEQVDFVWESSNPEFASIQKTDKLVGIKKGVTSTIVRHSGLKAERLVVVDQLERIEISVPKTSFQLGDTIVPNGKYFNKQGIETAANLTFTSSDVSIIRVNSSNELEAKKVGQSAITAEFNGITSSSVLVTVVADTISVASVEISSASSSIMLGDTILFSAVVKNINGSVLPGATITWNSSNISVLSVNSNGLATGIAVGSSDVTASSGNATSSASSVLVNPRVITSRTGNFMGRGNYNVNGSVTMSTLPNGSLKLDFANFSSSSGPGLYIYLSNSVSNGISIEALNSRTGNFTVNLPSNIAITDYNYVLIWCKPFGLTFGSALLN
ncbi:MAG: DM13 domain-containing protein [Flavobacteriales bacterium]|nr:DM13 domain-containing protein [Flavobacteriales bacterium]